MTFMELDVEQVYDFDQSKQLGATDWPNKWLKIISDKLIRRLDETKNNAFWKNELVELLEECIEVSIRIYI